MDRNKHITVGNLPSGDLRPDNPEISVATRQLQECMKPLAEQARKLRGSFQRLATQFPNLRRIANVSVRQFRLPEMTPSQKAVLKRRYDYFERYKAANADLENTSDAAVIYRGLSTKMDLAQLEDIGRRLGDPRTKPGRPGGSGQVVGDDKFFELVHRNIQAGMKFAPAARKVHKELGRRGALQPHQIAYRRTEYNRRHRALIVRVKDSGR